MDYFKYDGDINDEVKEFKSYEPGAYKFKVSEVVEKTSKNSGNKYVACILKTWLENNDDGPKTYANFFPFSDSDFPKEQFKAFVKVTTGNDKLTSLNDLLGKVGIVVLEHVDNSYLTPSVFGFYTKDRVSASGDSESIADRISNAMKTEKVEKTAYKAEPDKVEGKAEEDLPF